MNKITYSNSQRFHNTLITRLIQSLINPLLIFGAYSIVILVFYQIVCLKINDKYSLDDVSGKESNVSVMAIDLSIRNDEIDIGKYVNEDNDRVSESLQGLFDSYLNDTEGYLNDQHDYIKKTFDAVLEMRYNESEQFSTEQYKIINSLKSLNSSIMDQLNQDKEKIEGAKAQFDSAVYVGDKVDTSNLTLNFNDVQSSLNDMIDGFQVDYDNSSLSDLYDSRDEFHSELSDVFDDAIAKLKDVDTSIDIDDVSYTLSMVPNLISSNTTQNNGTSDDTSNFQLKTFKRDSTTNLVIIGIFLCVAYFLIMLYQYFRFRYQMSYTVSHMVDLEKTEEKFDYLGILQRTNEPTVTMLMDLQTRVLGKVNEAKMFWVNSFMVGDISNVPYMFMFCMFLFIVFLSLSKLEIDDVSLDTSNSRSIIVQKSYNLNQFDEFDQSNQHHVFQKSIDSFNNQTQSGIETLNDSLDDLYSKYNITSTLSISAPEIHHLSLTLQFPNFNTTNQLISQLQKAQYLIKSTTNVSDFQTSNIVQTISHIISSTMIQIVRTALIIAAISFFSIVTLGILYSFTI